MPSQCTDCRHPEHAGRRCENPIYEETTWDGHFIVNTDLVGTCFCIGEETTHQKSEGCWCGERISVEGSEQAVLQACSNFRLNHIHREGDHRDT